jgi:protein-tyrosine phosphatase
LKGRLALESCPYDVYRQASLLLNRTGDIRSQGNPSAYSVPDPSRSYARVLVEMGMSRDTVSFSESASSPTVFDCTDIVLIKREEEPVFHHIIDNLYLGDLVAASKEWEFMKDIDIVVDVSNSGYSELPGKEYVHLDIEDSRQTDIAVHFDRVSELVLHAREENKNVLVHCQQGVSRSVTLVLAYLVKHGSRGGLSLRDSVSYLKGKRAQSGRAVHPNIGFFRQLLKYEEQLLGRSSLSASDHRSIFS